MKKLAVVLAACVVLCIALCGCGSKKDDTSSGLEGTWKLATITDAEGTEYTLDEYCEANGVDAQGIDITYTFGQDGAGTAEIGGIGTDFAYEVNGSTVTISVNGQSADLNFDGSTLTSEDANTGITSTFTK